MPALLVHQLSKTLVDGSRTFRVLIPAFSLRSGERKAIVGGTGSGKTTAMDVLALASPADQFGQFEFRSGDGRVYTELGSAREALRTKLRRRHFGYLLQTNPLFPFLTLYENARIGQQLSGRVDDRYLRWLLDRVGLDLEEATRTGDMSVGQRQRLAMVRALAGRPAFLFCDEPTASLDERTAGGLMELLVELATRQGTAVLMITHDVSLASRHGFDIHTMVTTPSDNATGVLIPGRAPS